jgi:hypothetical protein
MEIVDACRRPVRAKNARVDFFREPDVYEYDDEDTGKYYAYDDEGGYEEALTRQLHPHRA